MACARVQWAALAFFVAGALAYSAAGAAEIVVDADKKYQTIEGYGTCLVSWVPRMVQLYNTPEFQRIYVEELGFNMLRVNVWGPIMPQPQEDWTKISYKDFVLTGEGRRAQVFIDFAKAIKKLNPDVKIIGTVWSPPAWMKENKSITDTRSGGIAGNDYRGVTNRVLPQYYKHFAKWLVEVLKLHAAEGVPFYAISPGNEIAFTQTFESCVWDAKDYATVVGILGEMMEQEGFGDVKIFGPEHMTGHNYPHGNPMYIQALMSDEKAAKYLDVFAAHGYTDGFNLDPRRESSVQFWELIKPYNRPYWMTEGGTGGHDWPAPLTGVAAIMHNCFVAGNASAFVPWQVTDSRANTHGLMVMDQFTPKTRAVQHYTRLIRPGAVRIDASPAYGDVMASAFLHPQDKTLTVVLINPTAQEQPVRIRFAQDLGLRSMAVWRTSATEAFQRHPEVAVTGQTLEGVMPPQSMVSLQGSVR